MATYSLKKFAQADVLKHIDDDMMLRFLEPYKAYLQDRGFFFKKDADGRINHRKLAQIFLTPSENTPTALVDALYFVQEVASHASFDELHEIAKAARLKVPDITTTYDLTVFLWLHQPDAIKQLHAEALIKKPKKFMSFQSRDSEGYVPDMPRKTIAALEKDMDAWFEDHNRGEGCEILICPVQEENKIYFLVRHGMPYKREGKIEQGRTGSVLYRPEVHDVIIYDQQMNELSIYSHPK